MVKLDDYVLFGTLEKFSSELFKGITDRPAYCVEIMKRAFGEDYQISPILSHSLADMFEKAITDLLTSKKIEKVSEIPGYRGETSVLTTSYKRA